jgi:hypothetical protein
MTPEMRQSEVVLGPIFVNNPYARPSFPSAPLLAATPLPRSPHPLRPNQKQKQNMSTTLALTNPAPMPKQHTAVVVLPRATSAFDQGSSPRRHHRSGLTAA